MGLVKQRVTRQGNPEIRTDRSAGEDLNQTADSREGCSSRDTREAVRCYYAKPQDVHISRRNVSLQNAGFDGALKSKTMCSSISGMLNWKRATECSGTRRTDSLLEKHCLQGGKGCDSFTLRKNIACV